MTAIVDTNFLVSLANTNEAEQEACVETAQTIAAIVAIAERLNVRRILTLDRRHFSVIRPQHCAAFELLPRG